MPSDDFDTLESERLVLTTLSRGDEARLQAVFDACRDFFQVLHAQPAPPPDAAAQELASAAAMPGRAAAVLSLADTGEDVGAIGWWRGNPAADRTLLGMLMVAPEHRGRGLAREALGALEVWLAGHGTVALRTAFPYRRVRVPPIVRALGFRELPIREHTALGMSHAGTWLWEKPIGGG